MMYFANPTKSAMPYMLNGMIGYIDTPDPKQMIRPPGAQWCADNACYAKGFQPDIWWAWLQSHTDEVGTCWFATAPDVVGDATATLELAQPWLSRIRELGYPPAFIAQDGIHDTVVPWDQFDWLFIGGTDSFKLGDEARTVIAEAQGRGKKVHLGRVNSLRRYRYGTYLGCDSADGTFLTFAPERNLRYLLGWLDDKHRQPPLFTMRDA